MTKSEKDGISKKRIELLKMKIEQDNIQFCHSDR